VKENGSTEAIEELGEARYSGYDSLVDSHNVCDLKLSKLELFVLSRKKTHLSDFPQHVQRYCRVWISGEGHTGNESRRYGERRAVFAGGPS
jgi:hypothetical protein